ncbi:serine/threonine-protein kinase PrkC [Thalassobacillus devorans]|uniref:non-specific serine/threonine protein kinase n=1 Tax=Thalassobacillus devorans TaxID=279813 RepID=A0ABQ1P4Y0_9BACI|nr:Stk1 family PASTA domain-containing Ser/Thr kinase [Thalassobacillus devorans]NIK27855.1 serine/threonine-protein kinase [Thalassobacillus devorans]GGC90834.1 serine/threonine-protein kinase PrkC [Thalassobacillus devorans]
MLNNRLLNERYLVKEMIGGGGMANVYLAEDTILERDVAIKVLRLEYGNDEEFIARFHREAQSATSLSHPNIVNIYDVGEEDDIYYMVMEHIDGMTLKKYIQLHSPVDVSDAIAIMQQVTSAIAHAHDNGIVHRDIKPENILIDHFGQVKVTDFGIAMALSATALTQTNSILGSVHYLSPEQARGGVATKKSDIYSMGIVLFELLTGRLPFSGESAVSVALKHLQNDTPSMKRWYPDLPQSVENVVLKATAKDPLQRYGNAHELEMDLETSLDPARKNEAPFTIDEDDIDEKTKAIPVITKEAFENHESEETIVHTNGNSHGTKPVPTMNEQPRENGEEKKAKKKKKKRVWPWLLTIFLVLLAGGIAALLLIPGLLEPKDVEMIDVTGMEYEEAFSELRNLNLQVERETEYSDTVEEGYVVRTNPEAGRTIKEGSTVTVYSSDGKETATFGDYVGEDFEKVKTELEANGYASVRSIQERSTDYPAGTIIEQIQPQPDEDVVPEDTRVIFEVSAGPPTVMLQDLRGRTQAEAESFLEDNNLEVKVEESFSDDTGEGLVMSQKPDPYQEVNEGSVVTIVISKGPEAKPHTKTVTVEVPYEPAQEETDEEENADDQGQDNEGQNGEGQDENNEEEPQEQEVIIYVDDMENDISEVYEKTMITEDTEFDIELIIAPGSEASYRVVRDGETVAEETVAY